MFGDIGDSANAGRVAQLTRSQNAEFDVMLGDTCYGDTALPVQLDRNYVAEHKAGKLLAAFGARAERPFTCGPGPNGTFLFQGVKLNNAQRDEETGIITATLTLPPPE